MIADLEPPKAMPPNLGPGYRPPFKPGFDPRRNHVKSSATLATKRQANALAPQLASTPLELVAKLSSLKRAHTRCLAACVASTSGKEASQWARAAKDVLEQLQSLLGHNPKPSKRGSTKHLAHVSPMANVEPIASQKVSPLVNHSCSSEIHSVTPVSPSETTIQSTSPINKDASQVKPEGNSENLTFARSRVVQNHAVLPKLLADG